MKNIFFSIIFILTFSLNPLATLAISSGGACNPNDSLPSHGCTDPGTSCQRSSANIPGFPAQNTYACFGHATGDVGNIFGNIIPPKSIIALGFGGEGIGRFFSNLISLIYIIAALVLIFMILWGAFDWMTSEGDKEKLQGAQRKIINAVIGIMLFAVAFAIIKVLGIFTGFEFFSGQNPPKVGP